MDDNDSEIEIISLGLWNLLKTHLGHALYHTFRGDTPRTLYSPYDDLVYCFDELQEIAEQEPTTIHEDNQARQDLSKLLEVISGGSSGDMNLDRYFKERPSYKEVMLEGKRKPREIHFVNLWTVFQPGMLVYGKPFQNQDQLFLVRDNPRLWPSQEKGRDYDPWTLWAWSYDWKDGRFVRNDVILVFEEFEGRRPLSSLPYAPLDALEDSKAKTIKEQLIKRGKMFREICECKDDERLFKYTGKAIPEKKGFSGMKIDGDEVGILPTASTLCILISYRLPAIKVNTYTEQLRRRCWVPQPIRHDTADDARIAAKHQTNYSDCQVQHCKKVNSDFVCRY